MRAPSLVWQSRALVLSVLASVGAVAVALTVQHGFGVRVCPWCVLQRGICLLVAVVAGLGWLLRGAPALRVTALALVMALCVAGLAAAYYQWDVASQLASCDLTLADQIITALKLESRLPYVFMVTASCADADLYHLLGLPYEAWSALLYLGLGGLCVYALRKSHRH